MRLERCRARRRFQDRHLADELSHGTCGENHFSNTRPLYNVNGASGNDEHGVSRLAFTADQRLIEKQLLLRHIGEDARAARVEKALNAAMADGSAKTRDVGGTATTAAYAQAVIARL